MGFRSKPSTRRGAVKQRSSSPFIQVCAPPAPASPSSQESWPRPSFPQPTSRKRSSGTPFPRKRAECQAGRAGTDARGRAEPHARS